MLIGRVGEEDLAARHRLDLGRSDPKEVVVLVLRPSVTSLSSLSEQHTEHVENRENVRPIA